MKLHFLTPLAHPSATPFALGARTPPLLELGSAFAGRARFPRGGHGLVFLRSNFPVSPKRLFAICPPPFEFQEIRPIRSKIGQIQIVTELLIRPPSASVGWSVGPVAGAPGSE